MSGYTTKFSIGNTVYFIEEETQDGGKCPCCGSRLSGKKVKKIHRSTVTEIHINKTWNLKENAELYQLSYPRCITAEKIICNKRRSRTALRG